jgi:hypothetical protein
MDGQSVLKQDNAQGAIVGFRNTLPFPDTAIMLNVYGIWILDGLFNPIFFNTAAVGALPGGLKVLRCLHNGNLSQQVQQVQSWLIIFLPEQFRIIRRFAGV